MRSIHIRRKKTNAERWTIEEEAILEEKRKVGIGFDEIRQEHFPHRSVKSLTEKCVRERWIFHSHQNWTDEKRHLLEEKRQAGMSFSEIASLPEFSEWSENSIKIESHRMGRKEKIENPENFS